MNKVTYNKTKNAKRIILPKNYQNKNCIVDSYKTLIMLNPKFKKLNLYAILKSTTRA